LVQASTVKLVLRSHFVTKKKWPYKTGDFLRGSIHMKFCMTGQEKGDCMGRFDCIKF